MDLERCHAALAAWAARELARHLDLDLAAATELADRAVTSARARTLPDESHQRNRIHSAASSLVTAAWATDRCPGGSAWWRAPEGARSWAFLEAGDAVMVEVTQAEALAGPFDLDFDVGWPAHKLFAVGLRDRPDLVPPEEGGPATVVLGDGEGMRARAVVERRGDQVGLVLVPDGHAHPTADLWGDAWDEALARCPG